MENEMQLMIQRLNYYTEAYDKGHPIISDEEWDKLYFKLVDLEKETHVIYPNSPTQKIHYVSVKELKKISHDHPMLSLAKTKDIEEIRKFIKKNPSIGMLKMDGLTCSLTYENGFLVKAETRGNGIIGEDITHNAFVIPSIPKRINYYDRLVIDGEIICKYNDFEPFSKDYKNPRNFASGSIRLLDAKECETRNLTFVAWDIIVGSSNKTLSEKLEELSNNYGFCTVPYILVDEDSLLDVIRLLKVLAQNNNFPIDGIVFKYNDCDTYFICGRTEHHFKGGFAYKFYDEEYETKLKDIEWTMGRTGVLTPVAIFEPVDDGESIIERASLHNYSIMRETFHQCLGWVGQNIKVAKMNMIIPQVMEVEEWDASLEYDCNYIENPTQCPICGGEIEYAESDSGVVNLVCKNPQCDGKFINRIDHFMGKKGLDVKGLSVKTLEKLSEWGWINSIIDLYNLNIHRNEWIQKEGFGEKSVDNILKAIEKSKTTSLNKFIVAIGIPLVGGTAANEICKHIKTWEEFRSKVDENFDFWTFNNFGIELNKSILNFNYEEADELAKLFNFEVKSAENKLNENIQGKTFVITGKLKKFKNRDEIKTMIEEAGGKVSGSVSSKTNYLINNDKDSDSSKNKKAKELNVPIISEDDFINLIN